MKKAFSIVEMAIVLVVIGLIAGLAYGGKNMIDAAKIKNDVSKVIKIKSAIENYTAKYNNIPGYRNDTDTVNANDIYSDLIRDGSLSYDDFVVKSSGRFYNFIGCQASDMNSGHTTVYLKAKTGSHLCLGQYDKHPADGPLPQYPTMEWSKSSICFYENGADDKNLYGGLGRAVFSGMNLDMKDCKKSGNDKIFYLVLLI